MRQRLACAVLLLAAACSGVRVPPDPPGAATSNPLAVSSTSPAARPDPPAPDPFEVKPAPAVYQDRYAGFQLSIPKGWFRFSISGIDSFAPTKARLAAYPEIGEWAASSTFTVLVIAHQNETFSESVKRVHTDHEGDDGSWTERAGRTGGRRSRTLVYTLPNSPGRSGNCACIDEYTVIQWSPETVLLLYVHAGSKKTFDRFRADSDRLAASLRKGPVDERASVLRQFLRARISGHGAEAWLTAKSKAAYDQYGLYKILDDDGKRMSAFSVDETRSSSRETTFFVAIGQTAGATARTERLVIGPGRNLSGASKAALVLEMTEDQAPGTS